MYNNYDVHIVKYGELKINEGVPSADLKTLVAVQIKEYALNKAYNIFIDPYRLIISNGAENVLEVSWYEAY